MALIVVSHDETFLRTIRIERRSFFGAQQSDRRLLVRTACHRLNHAQNSSNATAPSATV